MKKIFLLAVLVGVAFTSCVKNDEHQLPDEKQQIAFEPAKYKPVAGRAEVAFPTTHTFGAFAFVKSATIDHDIFIDNEEVGYNSTYNLWAPISTTYYWPESAGSHLDFISYAPYNADKTAAAVPQISDASDQQQTMQYLNYTVDASNPIDLMYSDKAVHFTHNMGDYQGYTGVPTLFRHALAKLNFKVRATRMASNDGKTTWETKVKSITLKGIHTTGSLKLTTVNDHTQMNVTTWTNTNVTTESPYNVWTTSLATVATKEWTYEQVLTSTAEDYQDKSTLEKASNYFVMPQKFLDNVQGMTIIYDVTTTTPEGHVGTATKTAEVDFYDYNGAVKAWEMGKSITYTIQIDPEGNVITFAPAIWDWETVDGVIDL